MFLDGINKRRWAEKFHDKIRRTFKTFKSKIFFKSDGNFSKEIPIILKKHCILLLQQVCNMHEIFVWYRYNPKAKGFKPNFTF